jgi:hypothetical protein
VATEAFVDTAGAAEHVAAGGLRDTAVIAFARAAELYYLQVLADGIQDTRRTPATTQVLADGIQEDAGNDTRFFMLARDPIIPPVKTCIVFAHDSEDYLHDISPQYTAETRCLLTHNCNNFSHDHEVAQLLAATPPHLSAQAITTELVHCGTEDIECTDVVVTSPVRCSMLVLYQTGCVFVSATSPPCNTFAQEFNISKGVSSKEMVMLCRDASTSDAYKVFKMQHKFSPQGVLIELETLWAPSAWRCSVGSRAAKGTVRRVVLYSELVHYQMNEPIARGHALINHVARKNSAAAGVSFQKIFVSSKQKHGEASSVSCDTGLRPLPWPSFNIVERYSVLCHLGRLWKPPWFPSLRQLIRCVPSTALQKLFTCMMLLSVNMAGCVLIP